VIETVTNTVVATPQGGGFPFGVAVTPDGKDVYATNLYGDSVIDTASNTVVATVPEGNYDMGIAVTPDGKRVYVTNARDGGLHLVSVIDTASKQVVATVAGVGYGPLAIAITPDGNYAYVTNLGSNTISVIATASKKKVATIPDVNSPSGVAVTPDGKHARHGQQYGRGHHPSRERPLCCWHRSAAAGRAIPRFQCRARNQLPPRSKRRCL